MVVTARFMLSVSQPVALELFFFFLFFPSLVDPLAYERHHRKEAVDTGIDPRAVLIAEASEKMRQQRSQYAKGLWNVAVVDVGGLAADIEDLAAVRLEGADETLAITRWDMRCRGGEKCPRAICSNLPQISLHILPPNCCKQ